MLTRKLGLEEVPPQEMIKIFNMTSWMFTIAQMHALDNRNMLCNCSPDTEREISTSFEHVESGTNDVSFLV